MGEKIVGVIVGIVLVFLVVVLLTALVYLIYDLATGRSCYAKTAEIMFPVQYDFWSGCRVEVEQGKWIPVDNYYYPDKNNK